MLHDVVDRHARVREAAGRVDVELDLLVRVPRLEVQDLGDDQVGDVVVDLLAEEDDALPQQQREDVVGPITAGGLVEDGGDERLAKVHGSRLSGCVVTISYSRYHIRWVKTRA